MLTKQNVLSYVGESGAKIQYEALSTT